MLGIYDREAICMLGLSLLDADYESYLNYY